MKSQSASAAPGITTAPRSVVQVPMTDGESTRLGEVSVSVSMLDTYVCTHGGVETLDDDEDDE